MDQARNMVDWTRRRKLIATVAITATLVIGIFIGTLVNGKVSAMHSFSFAGSSAAPLALPDPIPSSSSFSGIVNRVEPAVVNIATTQVIDRKSHRHHTQSDQDDQGEDFFFHFFDGQPGMGGQQQQPQAERSLGSGVILDKSGYILTNNHVIDQASKIQVQLNGDTTKYTAKLIGTDEESDLAVIKIDAGKDLPSAKLGNSDGVQVGDWVLAIGSPFGLNATVTAGIISAKDRNTVGNHQFQRFLQTDAAINPGNSGGPLVDMAGQVIGINTAILTGSRGYEGVGFAMPSTTAISVYDQIVKSGRVTRGSIGVQFSEELSTNQIALKSLGAPHGVIIEDVTPGSPAEKAGLKPTDVISAINGLPVKTGNDLVNPIATAPIGSKVKISYYRDKQLRETSATVEDRTHVFPTTAGRASNSQDDSSPTEFGLRVETLTPEKAQKVGYEGLKGVLVTEVEPTSFAEDLAFNPGDVISEVNGQAVSTVDEYRKAVDKLKPGENVVFKVLRKGGNADRVLALMLAGVVPADSK
jgi:serine protease Do